MDLHALEDGALLGHGGQNPEVDKVIPGQGIQQSQDDS